jgi:hypothetical protein
LLDVQIKWKFFYVERERVKWKRKLELIQEEEAQLYDKLEWS